MTEKENDQKTAMKVKDQDQDLMWFEDSDEEWDSSFRLPGSCASAPISAAVAKSSHVGYSYRITFDRIRG